MPTPTRKKTAKRKSGAAAAASYFCGIDIGGTFTDCVVRDQAGRLTIAKALSTPDDSARGFFDALTVAAGKMGLTLDELMTRTELLLHGTTLGTNALLERKGARVGLITTAGHADALIIMRSVGRSAGLPIQQLLHVSRHRKPEPLIPRHLIREVSERVDWSGEVVLPLNEEEAHKAIRELLAQKVEAIGVCFLWGFLHPEHELALKRMIQKEAPELYVTCGHELINKPGEYERSAAVAINCFIGPLMSRYVGKIEARARELGYKRRLVIMQSSGGVATAAEVADKPAFTIGSGPAGGLTACKFLGDLLGHKNIIASDVGGTSFDVGLVHEGQPLTGSETTLNQYTFLAPHLDVISIGSGGGSIIWVDPMSRTLKVGPESSGANPGPACYGRGGKRPTVTDANLLLGYLDPDYFLGGTHKLDREQALEAMKTVGDQLGMSPIEAASAAVQIVEFQMAELMRQMTVQRGFDPRDFVVYAYGGAAGAHCVTYTRELGCKTVVVPLGSTASTWSALGVQSADLFHVYEKSELFLAPYNAERINEIYEELEQRGIEQLKKDGMRTDEMSLERYAEMKFRLQIHLVEVPVPAGKLTAKSLAALERSFVEKYERLHGKGSAFTSAGVELGLLRVTARGRIRRPSLLQRPASRQNPRSGQREIYWSGLRKKVKTPIYDWTRMGAGVKLRGPAIVQMPETTVVVPPGTEGRVDAYGNFILTIVDRFAVTIKG
ncbi:MAG: hydantoinase/oxoprolinase family protein [Acidobacteriia bacterium]|nr:hydantoinase/oxoprolinase family protein [Terriglobia bacterium]